MRNSRRDRGCWVVVWKLSNIRLKRFTMTCLYQVSYLRLHQVSYLRLREKLVNFVYDMVVDTEFDKFYDRPFARVLYLFLMKDIRR